MNTANLTDLEIGSLQELFLKANPTLALRLVSPEEILRAEEIEILSKIEAQDVIPFSNRVDSVNAIVKVTRLCNLRCTYCFDWREDKKSNISFEVLAKTIRDLCYSNSQNINFIWHGGETTLRKIDFYRKIVWLQQRYCQENQSITNSIQTNCTLVSQEWALFWSMFNFIVGVSLDGPIQIHDSRRLDVAGKGTYSKVTEGLALIKKFKLRHGILAVVDDRILQLGPKAILKFWLDLGIPSVGLINVIPKDFSKVNQESFLPLFDFNTFLCELAEVWYPVRHLIRIREFDSLLNNIAGKSPVYCINAGNCLKTNITIEPNGDLSSCDKFLPQGDHLWDNISNGSIGSLIEKSKKVERLSLSYEASLSNRTKCENYHICKGGCPNDNNNFKEIFGHDPSCCGSGILIKKLKSLVGAE